MVTDLHVHTLFSCDSKTTMAQYCEEAIIQGIGCICFTDHVDCNKNDDGYGYYNAAAYFEEFKRIREQYSHKIKLLSGIEFSEPHVYPREFEDLLKLPYDFVLGSVHYWIDDLFPSRMEAKGITLEQAFERYWEEVYKAVAFGGFDSLAHMDFPKRYYKSAVWKEAQVTDICKVMLKNNISLEINTSSLRKGLSEAMPGKELLYLFEKAGGRNITIGADSHSIEELGKGYGVAIEMLYPSMVNGYYQERKFTGFSE
jgi:histidinol-phosphatase (PHP family)